MLDDQIVDEIRAIREHYAGRFGFDVRAMAEYLKAREREQVDRLVSYPPKPARRRKTA